MSCDLLEEFWRYVVESNVNTILHSNNPCPEFKTDMSEFVAVDGEEGDHGKITYSDLNGRVVAIKTVHGGDDYDVEFSEHGRLLMILLLVPLIDQAIFGDESKQKSICDYFGWFRR